MKILRTGLALATVILSSQIASGQSFANLDFEDTTITAVLLNPFSGIYAYIGNIPRWSWSPLGNAAGVDPDTEVSLNTIVLNAPAVTLHGVDDIGYPAIEGNYSILLQSGGSRSVPSTGYSAIWQTGQVPSNAKSISYWGGALQVTFNGQPLTPVAISNAANYTIWGADISAYAGQTGELRFTKPWLPTSSGDGALLDNIQFSSMQVPEPSALALCGLSLLFVSGTRFIKTA
jgi:hypothetical protein